MAARSTRGSSFLDAMVEVEEASIARGASLQAEVRDILGGHGTGGHIDMKRLRALSRLPHGLPDDSGLRAKAWRLFLNVLPPEREAWDGESSRKKEQYMDFLKEFGIGDFGKDDKGEERRRAAPSPGGDEEDGAIAISAVSDLSDHPLCQDANSKWDNFFKDNDLMAQIERDVERTHPDLQFFSTSHPEGKRFNEHQESLRRSLFLYAKLNPGLKYVQGMNELLAPLYHCYRTDPDESFAMQAEVDAFFSLMDLLSEFRDHYCQQLDNSTVGIKATLTHLSNTLSHYDHELWDHLENGVKIQTQFYAFRWITLLFTQEFTFPDVIKLWDYLLSDERGRMAAVIDVACALLIHIRSKLLGGDFASNVKLLQNYPPVDLNDIIRLAGTFST